MNFCGITDIFKTQKLDALLVSSSSHLSYLTSYPEFSSIERDAYLLITLDEAYLFTHPLISGELSRKIKGITTIEYSQSTPLAKKLGEIIEKNQLKIVGFESDNLTVSEYLSITEHTSSRFISVRLDSLRAFKTVDEVRTIKKACAIALKAYTKTIKRLTPDVTEKEIANIFQENVFKLGTSLSFPTIVAFGKNSAIPHHTPDETKLRTSDIVLMDFGVKYNNYCSDMTRTFFVGKPTKEQQNAYQVVEKSQQKATALIEQALKDKKPLYAFEADNVAREYITSQDYPTIPHSLGHGIGIEVHEAPRLGPNSNDLLEEGMVFSIEPGIYIKENFGIRIEDLYLIKNHKLTKLPE